MKRLALLLLPFLLLCGCLQFDAQDITVRYDEKNDRLDLLLVYRGLYCNREIAADVDQLESALRTGEFAIWSNWPLKVDLTEAKGPLAALADHVQVENGSLFTTPTGQLCGYQFVRLTDVDGFLKKANDALALWVRAEVLGKELRDGGKTWRLDDETEELLLEVARGRHRVLSRKGAAFVLSVPCSDRDHLWLLGQLRDEFGKSTGFELGRRLAHPELPGADDNARSGTSYVGNPGALDAPLQIAPDLLAQRVKEQPMLRVLFENPWSLRRTEGLTEFTLGFDYRSENRFHKAPLGVGAPNLEPEAKRRGIPVENSVPDQEITRRFDAFCAREAKLPEALAVLRGK